MKPCRAQRRGWSLKAYEDSGLHSQENSLGFKIIISAGSYPIVALGPASRQQLLHLQTLSSGSRVSLEYVGTVMHLSRDGRNRDQTPGSVVVAPCPIFLRCLQVDNRSHVQLMFGESLWYAVGAYLGALTLNTWFVHRVPIRGCRA